jgi:hypothetical protein
MTGGDLHFRLLTHEVEITCDSPELLSSLCFLAQDAEQAGDAIARIRFAVETQAPERLMVSVDGDPVGIALDPEGARDLIYRVLHQAVHEGLASHMRIHAGLATLGKRRVLFVGRKGAGKTTLMLGLLADGKEVQADEMVLIDDRLMATPWPRRFHAREGTFRLVPSLAALRPHLPAQSDRDGQTVWAISPRDLGHPWRISPAPVDDIVFIRPVHGQPSRIAPLEGTNAVGRLTRRTTFPDRSIAWLSAPLRLIHCSRTFLLYNGCLEESKALLLDLFCDSCCTGDAVNG